MNYLKIIFLSILVSCGIGGAKGPLNFEAKWFQHHVAYSMAKFGMSLVTLGMSLIACGLVE
jgi:hypothetical protein